MSRWSTVLAFPPTGRRAHLNSVIPWEHYREIAMSGGKPAGHCMLIIGSDDDMESTSGTRGAMLLQNSWGPKLGHVVVRCIQRYPNLPEKKSSWYAWITYEALTV